MRRTTMRRTTMRRTTMRRTTMRRTTMRRTTMPAPPKLGVIIITIFLLNAHPLLRQSLKTALERQSDLSVVGEASNGQTGLTEIMRLKPQVVISDLLLPGLPGLEVARYLHKHAPTIQVIIFSLYEDPAYIKQAQINGAARYIPKNAPLAELINATRELGAQHS